MPQKEQNVIFYTFVLGLKTLNLTESFAGDRKCFQCKKLWPKCVSLTKSWKTNFSVMEFFFSDRIFFWGFFLWHFFFLRSKLVSVLKLFFKQKHFCFCDKNLFSPKKPCFWELIHDFQKKISWEIGVSFILDNKDNTFVDPCTSVVRWKVLFATYPYA